MTEEWERCATLRKRCTLCGKVKPWTKFDPKTKWPDGTVRTVQSACRVCRWVKYGARYRKQESAEAHARRLAYFRQRYANRVAR